MEEHEYIEALIRLHSGLERQGPGDPKLSMQIIEQLPKLPTNPSIADIGCGAGAGALILAKRYRSKVKAVDFSKVFLKQMMDQAKTRRFGGFNRTNRVRYGELELGARNN